MSLSVMDAKTGLYLMLFQIKKLECDTAYSLLASRAVGVQNNED